MMKKVIPIILFTVSAILLSACGRKEELYEIPDLSPYRKLQRQESSNQTFLIKESTNLESTVVPRAAVLFLILIVKKKM